MSNQNSSIDVIESVKDLLNLIPNVGYGNNVINNINITNYGQGIQAYNLLLNDFNEIDFNLLNEQNKLKKSIKLLKSELKELEIQHTNVTEIIGNLFDDNKGSVAYQLIENLKSEIDNLILKRDNLLNDINALKNEEYNSKELHKENLKIQIEEYNQKKLELEEGFQEKINNLNDNLNKLNIENTNKINEAKLKANHTIKEVEEDALQKVKLIKQFKDFLSETNENMKLYSKVIIGIIVLVIIIIGFSIPDLLKIYESYNLFIKSHKSNITNWQIINYSIGLLIIKLPWAIVISAILTSIFGIFKGLLLTYEKINQDKRNMSAIYSISGNVANSLNEYGISLIDENTYYDDSEEIIVNIKVSKKDLELKKENFRWLQIMKYFEGMNNVYKINEKLDDDKNINLISGVINKMVDKKIIKLPD